MKMSATILKYALLCAAIVGVALSVSDARANGGAGGIGNSAGAPAGGSDSANGAGGAGSNTSESYEAPLAAVRALPAERAAMLQTVGLAARAAQGQVAPAGQAQVAE